MSGTSLDGVDAVLATLDGSGPGVAMDVHATAFVPYPDPLRALLLEQSAVASSDVRTLAQLHARLPHVYADAVHAVLAQAGRTVEALDLVGCHGQTVHHVPDAEPCAGLAVASTLQIGDPAVLAKLLGVVVVGDFRTGDVALGGQGAPLVPYFDFVRFAVPDETRGLLNLGGIANLTVLPARAGAEDVYAFDTGPANMVVDRLVQRLFAQPFDHDGRIAASGTVDEALLARLLDDAYLHRPPPKSTGREKYDEAFVSALLHDASLASGTHAASKDAAARTLVATATAFTAASVHDAYVRFVQPRHRLDVLIASGGGRRNPVLMDALARRFAPVPVRPIDPYGVDSDSKEALCFALLAHEALNGVPTSMPGVTGARAATVLGKICV